MIWEGAVSTTFPFFIQPTARRKLVQLHAAAAINDLRTSPGNKLEKLEGTLKDFYGVRINDHWRIIFRWHNGNAFEVAIVDYH
nr:type II toxin-antitoxin system RelE/ParE family toxin [Chryseolinea lacunae]